MNNQTSFFNPPNISGKWWMYSVNPEIINLRKEYIELMKILVILGRSKIEIEQNGPFIIHKSEDEELTGIWMSKFKDSNNTKWDFELSDRNDENFRFIGVNDLDDNGQPKILQFISVNTEEVECGLYVKINDNDDQSDDITEEDRRIKLEDFVMSKMREIG
ncbi:Hypothetical protein HVR_LOCUS1026 [uncultured virus]|nr:Hypothetical protein HVR_LOCUS1026 [uncultured virus]